MTTYTLQDFMIDSTRQMLDGLAKVYQNPENGLNILHPRDLISMIMLNTLTNLCLVSTVGDEKFKVMKLLGDSVLKVVEFSWNDMDESILNKNNATKH